MQMQKSRLHIGAMVIAAIAGVLLVHAPRHAYAQSSSDAIPRLADGHPDLSGVWWSGGDIGGRGARLSTGTRGNANAATFTSLYKPEAAAAAAKLSDKNDPTLKCVPTAFGTLNVRLWSVGAVGQIVATPKLVVLLSETFHDFQLVPTDGRPHRDDQPPTRRGDAVGRWEGDTFVVDVTNFTDDTWMFAEGRVSIHSDALRIVERYTRVDANTLEIEAVVEDPGVLTAPWTVPKQTLVLAPFDALLSLDCAADEADAMIESASQKR